MRVNLAGETKNIYRINWVKIILVILSILLIVTIGAHYYILLNRYFMVKEEVNKYKNQTMVLSQKKNEYFDMQNKINKLEEYKKEIQKYEYYWDDIIEEMGYVIPDKLQLNNLQIENKLMIIRGRAEDNYQVIILLDNLKESQYFSNAKIIKLNKKEETIFEIETDIASRGD